MKEELYINELTRFLEETKRFLKLYKDRPDPPRSNDLDILKEIALSTQDIISVASKDDPNIKKILASLRKFISAVDKADLSQIVKGYEELSDIKSGYEFEKERIGKLMEVFKIDLREMELHEAKINTLQNIVSMELKRYGEVLKETLEVVDVQHCEVSDGGIVREKTEKEEIETLKKDASEKGHGRDRNEKRNGNAGHGMPDQDIQTKPERKPEQSYKANVYMKNTSDKKQKPKVIYGSSPEDIIATLQGWNMGRTDEMKFRTCYVAKLDAGTNKYTNLAKYDVATGMDITPIYLNLPHMERNEFMKTIDQLKKDGAKYNPIEKKYFVTKQLDLNKFSKYLPIAGTQAEVKDNQSRSKLSYEVESGQEYYDNRVLITIEGMEPFNVYGEKYDVHFPSLPAESTREIIEKFVLPEIDMDRQHRKVAEVIEFNGKSYEPLQYNVLELAMGQNFTKEQMLLLERPDLSSDRMNEIRFAIKDGLSADQIAQFATPAHEQWQMDFCRIGMQHGLQYSDLKDIINPDNYSREQWGERRNQLAQMIKSKEKEINARLTPEQPQTEPQSKSSGKTSVISKISQNKAKIEASRTDEPGHPREMGRALEK